MDDRKGATMNPTGVMLGLFVAVCGLALGRIASEQVEAYNSRKKARYEWAKRKQQENDHE